MNKQFKDFATGAPGENDYFLFQDAITGTYKRTKINASSGGLIVTGKSAFTFENETAARELWFDWQIGNLLIDPPGTLYTLELIFRTPTPFDGGVLFVVNPFEDLQVFTEANINPIKLVVTMQKIVSDAYQLSWQEFRSQSSFFSPVFRMTLTSFPDNSVFPVEVEFFPEAEFEGFSYISAKIV